MSSAPRGTTSPHCPSTFDGREEPLARIRWLFLAFLLVPVVPLVAVVPFGDAPPALWLASEAALVGAVVSALLMHRRGALHPLDMPLGATSVLLVALDFGTANLAVVALAFVTTTSRAIFGSLPRAVAGAFITWLAMSAAVLARPDAGHGLEGWQMAGPLVVLAFMAAMMNTLARMVGQRHELEQALRHLAYHDPLTGLANRALFHHRLEAELAENGATAVLALDLDGFKLVNDTLGHQAGDEVLVVAARRLAETAGPHALAARMGGDEFAVLMPDADARGADELAARLREALAAPYSVQGLDVQIAASVGLALAPVDGGEGDALVRRADARMYEFKRGAARHARPPLPAPTVALASRPSS